MNRLSYVPFFMLLNREIQRFLKVVAQTIITPFVNSFLYLLIFGIGLGSRLEGGDTTSYLAFLIPGLVMMSVLNNAFQNATSSVVGSKFSGELEDLRMVPLSTAQVIWALSFGGLVRGILVGGVTLFLGMVFYNYHAGEALGMAHPFAFAYFAVIGGLAFAKLGIAVAFWSKSFDQVGAFGGFVLLPLIYLGGVFISIEHLHPFWKTVSMFNPLLYFINGLRYGVIGVSDVNVWWAALISGLGLVFFHGVAWLATRTGSFVRW